MIQESKLLLQFVLLLLVRVAEHRFLRGGTTDTERLLPAWQATRHLEEKLLVFVWEYGALGFEGSGLRIRDFGI